MSNPALPEWLQDNPDDAPSKDVELNAPASAATVVSSVEMDTAAPSASTTAAASSSSKTSKGRRCLKFVNAGISLFFFVIFIISATFQNNDTGGSAITWLLFYVFHAVVACACFMLQFCCKALLGKFVMVLAASMLVWSVVMVAISAVHLADAPSGGSSQGGDNPNKWTDKEEKAFEVAGASLGLASVFYHIIVFKFCCKSEAK